MKLIYTLEINLKKSEKKDFITWKANFFMNYYMLEIKLTKCGEKYKMWGKIESSFFSH